jgi:hypothetical protein
MTRGNLPPEAPGAKYRRWLIVDSFVRAERAAVKRRGWSAA